MPISRVFKFIFAFIILSAQAVTAQNYSVQLVSCGAYTLRPAAINNSGTVVGQAQTATSKTASGFVYYNGTCQTTPPGVATSFLGIDDASEIFGLYTDNL